ncbi:HIT family protein [Massilia sp. Dwa41.01b]|uniref:HIT family protein n=1 Tax=unclassified Massilia TaxID=2609279 RepID=UPI0016014B70|nr:MULTISPECIES: HIT family protein [unclassified Massilia]QNA87677.1 HIT family protein [Massilia sp. Dwa41.01b]QNA98579.1 HIT family protein [Massilia sp. Se16.2.3]
MTEQSLREPGCELCSLSMPTVWEDDKLAVIIVDDANYPGFCRVIWRDHVREMSDLAKDDRLRLMDAVHAVELAVREVMAPTKVNVASLGNVVPHLHWHVIPRYPDDAHFPAPVWATASRATDDSVLAARRALLPQLADAIVRYMKQA